MAKYKAFDPKSEVIGQSMLGFIQCIRHEEIAPFLTVHGLDDIKPDRWYPLQKWLDVLSSLAADRPGQAMFDFVAAGMKVAELMMLGEIYQGAHRGDVGETTLEVVSVNHIKVINRVPYPDDFMYGANYGAARRFIKDKRFTVYYDEKEPRREQGGQRTVVHITWEM